MLRCIRVVLQSSNSSFGFNYMGGQHIHIPLYVFHSHLNFFFESCLLFCVDTRIAIIAEARKVTGSHMLLDIFWWCTSMFLLALAGCVGGKYFGHWGFWGSWLGIDNLVVGSWPVIFVGNHCSVCEEVRVLSILYYLLTSLQSNFLKMPSLSRAHVIPQLPCPYRSHSTL